MELTERWKSIDWQASEFSYAKADLLADLKKESGSELTRLLNRYKRTYALMLVLAIATPFCALLKPDNPEFVVSIGIIWSYYLVLSGFLTLKFSRFTPPDLSLQPTETIRASLAFVRSINSFQANFVSLYMPVLFLGSLMAILTYEGKHLATIIKNPFSVAVIVGSTLLVVGSGKTVKRFLGSRQCRALMNKLEQHLHALEQP